MLKMIAQTLRTPQNVRGLHKYSECHSHFAILSHQILCCKYYQSCIFYPVYYSSIFESRISAL